MSALVLGVLLQAALASPSPVPPRYPLAVEGSRDFTAIEGPRLVDLDYTLTDSLSSLHRVFAAFQFGTSGFARAWFEGEDRGIEFENARLKVEFGGNQGSYRSALDYVGRRFKFKASALARSAATDGGVSLAGGLTRELAETMDVFVLGSGETKTRRFPSEPRILYQGTAGLAYQRAPAFDLSVAATWRRVHTQGDIEFSEAVARLESGGAVLGSQFGIEGEYADRRGRLSHRDLAARARLGVPLFPRLLLEGAGNARAELGGAYQEYGFGGALTFFGRRTRLARTGAAARSAAELARLTRQAGYFERVHFEPMLEAPQREMRRRAALLADPEGLLAEGARALHAAEVEDRTVPRLHAGWSTQWRAVEGVRETTITVSAGAPWPAALSFQADDSCARFLSLNLDYRRQVFASGFVSLTRSAGLVLDLNREIFLRASWSSVDGTPVDRLRGIGKYRVVEIRIGYSYGR